MTSSRNGAGTTLMLCEGQSVPCFSWVHNATALDSLCRHEDHPILEQRRLPFLRILQQGSMIGYIEGTYSAKSLLDLIRPAFENRHCSEEAGDQAGCRNELIGADLWHE